MNPKYTIRNFRIFDEKGATIELAPVTFLTGCNSSGKSSITKSMLVLNNYLEKLREDLFTNNGNKTISYSNYTINFLDDNLKSLGRFDKILNETSQDRSIYFEYTVHSPQLMKDINVQYRFVADEKNGIANGLFKELKIMDMNDTIIYCYSDDTRKVNYHALKDSFFKHCYLVRNIDGFVDKINQFQTEFSFGDEDPDSSRLNYDKFRGDFKQWKSNQNENDFIDALNCYSCKDTVLEGSSFTNNSANWEWKKDFFQKIANNNRIVCNLPILREFSGVPKVAVRLKFEDFLLRAKMDPTEKECLDWMLNDFESSSFDSFIDYYREKENEMFRAGRSVGFEIFKNEIGDGLYRSPLYFRTLGEVRFDDDNAVTHNTIDESVNDAELWKKQGVRFPWMYELLCSLSDELLIPTEEYYHKNEVIRVSMAEGGFQSKWVKGYSNIMGETFFDFANNALKKVICPDFLHDLVYVNSSIATVKRLYDINSKDDFSSLMKRYIQPDKVTKADNKSSNFVSHWLKAFGIGEYLSFESDKEGAGINIYLHRTEKDTEGRLLADEGYGYTHIISLLLQIECMIRNESKLLGNQLVALNSFKWVKENRDRKKPQLIIVEEPENHLHPNLQSQMADMFLDAYQKHGIHFLVETHSEYIIRRSQVLVAEMCKERGIYEQEDVDSNNPFRTFYVPKGGYTYDLQYSSNGKFIQLFGEGFCDEADKWSIRLFDLENE